MKKAKKKRINYHFLLLVSTTTLLIVSGLILFLVGFLVTQQYNESGGQVSLMQYLSDNNSNLFKVFSFYEILTVGDIAFAFLAFIGMIILFISIPFLIFTIIFALYVAIKKYRNRVLEI